VDVAGSGTEVAAFFDAEAGGYDAAYDERSPGGHALRARLATTLRLLEGERGQVLDAGMGPGRLVVELDHRGWEVSGTDVAEEMVTRARARLPEAADRLLHARIEALPFADAGFDAVVATGVLEYVDDLPAAVSELARVLRPGGRAVVSAPNPRSLYGMWRRLVVYPAARLVKGRIQAGRGAPPPGTRIRPQRFMELLAGAGMEIEAVEHVNFQAALTPLDELFPRAALRLAERLEGGNARSGSVLATQLVFAARKRTRPLDSP
jgi:ubiquinone/menaquinone biosynthesis C-methylase UbiE